MTNDDAIDLKRLDLQNHGLLHWRTNDKKNSEKLNFEARINWLSRFGLKVHHSNKILNRLLGRFRKKRKKKIF